MVDSESEEVLVLCACIVTLLIVEFERYSNCPRGLEEQGKLGAVGPEKWMSMDMFRKAAERPL
jgi:hypothetical protein